MSCFTGVESHASTALVDEKKSAAPVPSTVVTPPTATVTATVAIPPTATATVAPAKTVPAIKLGVTLVGISEKNLALALLAAPNTASTVTLKSGQHTLPAANETPKKSYFTADFTTGTDFLARIRETITSGTCIKTPTTASVPKFKIECTHTFPLPIGKHYKSVPGRYEDTPNMKVIFWIDRLMGSYTNIEALNKAIAGLPAGSDGLTTFHPVTPP
ncbi:MAG: hypothetical protein ACTHJ4_03840 [Candidatus Nucleicultricaceae bacterium]